MQVLRLGRFIFNHNTKQELINSNLVLHNGEIAVEQDTQLMKMGDGKTLYKDLPYLNRGEKGDKGDKGATGETGAALSIKGSFSDISELPASGTIGDGYMVAGDLYLWSDTNWVNVGQIKGEKGDKGDKGNTGAPAVLTISPLGTWVINGVDSGALARGPKGDTGDLGPRGFTGEKGEPFTYSDFTPAQIEALKVKGDKGDTGPPGVNATTTEVATENADGLMSSDHVIALNNKQEKLTAGTNVTIDESNVISATDTTYDVATTTTDGLMSSADKTKLNGVPSDNIKRSIVLTQSAYDALSTSEKNRTDTIYFVTG